MSSTDQQLIERAKRGDNAAFGELWARYERLVVALCRRYVKGSIHDPAVDDHDLATETFIRALHHLHQYEETTGNGGDFEAWLLKVARHICLNSLAKQQRRQRWSARLDEDEDLADQPDFAPLVERVVEEGEVLRIAAQEINALPDLYRTPFKLFLEEYSQKEIAETLGISVENAAKRVQRARTLLQPKLAELFEEEWQAMMRDKQQRRARASLRAVEQALTDIVSEHRIVNVTLPSGGEMQLCLRVDVHKARREQEIESRRAQLSRQPRAGRKRLELADLCYHSGRWEEAQREYREALAINPRCFAAALRLGAMFEREQKSQQAAHVYRAALRQKPPSAIRAQLRAHLLAAEGKDEEAVKVFRRAITLAPKEKDNYYGLHDVLGRLSRYEEQLENVSKIREVDPDDLFALIGGYMPCARLRRFDIARSLLERAVEVDPNHPMAVKHLFQVRMNLRLFDDDTLHLAERLVRLAPQFVESWGELAWIYMELGRNEESVAVLKKFIEEHPQNAEAHAALSWRYHHLGRLEEQVAHARRAYELMPQNWYVCWTVLVAGKTVPMAEKEAFRYADEILTRFPHDAFMMMNVSLLYRERERMEEALTCAQRAVALNPTYLDAQMVLAWTYSVLQRWEEAAEGYRRVVEMPGGRNVEMLSSWGRALTMLNSPEAKTVFAQAAALASTSSDYFSLGVHLEASRQRDKAIAAYRQCVSLSPPDHYVRARAEDALRRMEGEVRGSKGK